MVTISKFLQSDNVQIKTEVRMDQDSIDIRFLDANGNIIANTYTELTGTVIEHHIWNEGTPDGADPDFSGTLLDLEHGKSET